MAGTAREFRVSGFEWPGRPPPTPLFGQNIQNKGAELRAAVQIFDVKELTRKILSGRDLGPGVSSFQFRVSSAGAADPYPLFLRKIFKTKGRRCERRSKSLMSKNLHTKS